MCHGELPHLTSSFLFGVSQSVKDYFRGRAMGQVPGLYLRQSPQLTGLRKDNPVALVKTYTIFYGIFKVLDKRIRRSDGNMSSMFSLIERNI